MTKLSTMFSIAALTVSLAGAGCTGTKDEEAKAPAAKPTDDKPAEAAKPDEIKPGEVKPTGAGGDLPPACVDYKASIDKLATCAKAAQPARDALKQAYDQAAAGWPALSAEGKAALATICTTAADGVKKACGW